MPDITPEPIQQYASDHTSEPGPLFAELAAVTRERMTSHGMMSGNTVGRLLQAPDSRARRAQDPGDRHIHRV